MSEDVSQVSLPIRILLVGAVVFMAAYLAVLRPEEEPVPAPSVATAPATPAAPQSSAGRYAAKAKAGAATAEADAAGAANADVLAEDGAPATGTAAPSRTGSATEATESPAAPALPALPALSLKGLPKAMRTGLEERRVLVLGVLNTEGRPWAPMADDDRAVRNVLDDVNRYRGGVVVRTTPITRLARYDGLLKALQVTQSPTVVVVDRNRRAMAIEGYVDRATVNQAIADARDTSIAVRVKDPYLRKVNRFCGEYKLLSSRSSIGQTVRGGERRLLMSYVRTVKRVRARFAGFSPPARWRTLDRRFAGFITADLRGTQRVLAVARAKGHNAAVRTSRRERVKLDVLLVGLDRRFTRAGLTACSIIRTR